jgi:hypothetical protein
MEIETGFSRPFSTLPLRFKQHATSDTLGWWDYFLRIRKRATYLCIKNKNDHILQHGPLTGHTRTRYTRGLADYTLHLRPKRKEKEKQLTQRALSIPAAAAMQQGRDCESPQSSAEELLEFLASSTFMASTSPLREQKLYRMTHRRQRFAMEEHKNQEVL